jgi:hypothetical protein
VYEASSVGFLSRSRQREAAGSRAALCASGRAVAPLEEKTEFWGNKYIFQHLALLLVVYWQIADEKKKKKENLLECCQLGPMACD